jgi:biopolymer transport protein ExbB/TolQ
VSARSIEHAIFNVADALRVPVLLAALLALAIAVFEAGRVSIEMWERRRRSLRALEAAGVSALALLGRGDADGAAEAIANIGHGSRMRETLKAIFARRDFPDFDDWSAKALADFDYESLRKLERTRILVRIGPALGLMGTLILLSPGLAALSRGDTATLSTDLRVAFSITVLGLLVGAIAFAISLVRDRLYSQDLSDLEYLVSVIATASPPAPNEARDPLEVT